MYTLKGVFPDPKKEQKRNFIRENMKQLKIIQGKVPKDPKEGKFTVRLASHEGDDGAVRSVPSQGRCSPNKSNSRKKLADVRIKKGDMAEFLKRKEQRKKEEPEKVQSSESLGLLRDIGCQTTESNLSKQLEENTTLTVLYPRKDDMGKGSGDSGRRDSRGNTGCERERGTPQRDEARDASERPRSRLNAILERKDKAEHKDPYLPSGYQKGVVPRYLRERERKGDGEGGTAGTGPRPGDAAPQGHVTLPDCERRDTLRMLRNSFAELVSELNKMPVKTDTLRMRNRKMELEKQLAKLEEGIKVFSRPKVFVKIGE